MKKLRVTVDGKAYHVLVERLDPDSTSPTAAAPAPLQAAPVTGGTDVVSPLAGKIVSIDVTVGQAVAAGTQVATVEAMKMNTYIHAPRAGTIAAVLVNTGDGVEEGSPILRLG